MAYQISAQLVLQGPSNLAQVAAQINRGLSGVSVPVGVAMSPQAVAQLAATQQQMAQTGRQAQTMAGTMGVANTQLNNVNRTAQQTARAMTAVNTVMTATNRSLGQTGQLVRQTTGYFTRLGETAQAATQRFIAFVAGAGTFMAVVSSVRSATAAALDFEKSMNKISQVSNESDASVRLVSDAIGKVSQQYGVSSAEMAKAALVLTQAGISAKDAAKSMEVLGAAAAAPNFESMKQTSESVVALMRQFKLDADGVTQAIGAMDAVAAKFAVEASDLVTAVQKTGGAFAAAGGSVNELLGVFTSIRATTRESASEVAVGLRTILARTQRADVLEQLKAFQVELRYTADEAKALGDVNLTGQFVGAMEAFRRLSQATKGLQGTDPRFASIVDSLGGYRQISRVIPLLQQFGEAEKAVGVAGAGSVSLFTNAEKSTETLSAKLGQTKENFLELFRTIAGSGAFKAFAEGALGLATSLGKILQVAEPLLPLLTAMATVKIVQSVAGYVGAAVNNTAFASARSRPFGANQGGRIGYNTGGMVGFGVVPGVGSSDTVPADLPAGSFVIRQSSSRRIGYDNLHAMAGRHGYASGGSVSSAGTAPTVPTVLTPGEFVFSPGQTQQIGVGNLQQLNGGGQPHILRSPLTRILSGGQGVVSGGSFDAEELARLMSTDDLAPIDLPGRVSQVRPRTVGERLGVRRYTHQGDKLVNSFLRTGQVPQHPSYPGLTREELEEYTSLLDGAMRAGVVTSDAPIYRGLNDIGFLEDMLSRHIFDTGVLGQEIIEPGFLSTTTDKSRALRYAARGRNPALLEIVPRINKNALSLHRPDATHHLEDEILLPRSQSLRIVGATEIESVYGWMPQVMIQQLADGGLVRLNGGGPLDESKVRAYLRSIGKRFDIDAAQYDHTAPLFAQLPGGALGMASTKPGRVAGLQLSPAMGSLDSAPGRYTPAHELGHVLDYLTANTRLIDGGIGVKRHPLVEKMIQGHGLATQAMLEQWMRGGVNRRFKPGGLEYFMSPQELFADAFAYSTTGLARFGKDVLGDDSVDPKSPLAQMLGVTKERFHENVLPLIRSAVGPYREAAHYADGGHVPRTFGSRLKSFGLELMGAFGLLTGDAQGMDQLEFLERARQEAVRARVQEVRRDEQRGYAGGGLLGEFGRLFAEADFTDAVVPIHPGPGLAREVAPGRLVSLLGDHPLARKYGVPELLKLAGVLPGSSVMASSTSSGQLNLNWLLNHEGGGRTRADRSIWDDGGGLRVLNGLLRSGAPGVGTSVYLRQLDALSRHGGVAEMVAAGDHREKKGGDWSGYHVWPSKFGVDGVIPTEVRRRLRYHDPELVDMLPGRGATVQQLLALPGGESLWERAGGQFDGVLDPNSPRVLELANGHLRKILSGDRKKFAGGGPALAGWGQLDASPAELNEDAVRQFLRKIGQSFDVDAAQYDPGHSFADVMGELVGEGASALGGYHHPSRRLGLSPFVIRALSGDDPRELLQAQYTAAHELGHALDFSTMLDAESGRRSPVMDSIVRRHASLSRAMVTRDGSRAARLGREPRHKSGYIMRPTELAADVFGLAATGVTRFHVAGDEAVNEPWVADELAATREMMLGPGLDFVRATLGRYDGRKRYADGGAADGAEQILHPAFSGVAAATQLIGRLSASDPSRLLKSLVDRVQATRVVTPKEYRMARRAILDEFRAVSGRERSGRLRDGNATRVLRTRPRLFATLDDAATDDDELFRRMSRRSQAGGLEGFLDFKDDYAADPRAIADVNDYGDEVVAASELPRSNPLLRNTPILESGGAMLDLGARALYLRGEEGHEGSVAYLLLRSLVDERPGTGWFPGASFSKYEIRRSAELGVGKELFGLPDYPNSDGKDAGDSVNFDALLKSFLSARLPDRHRGEAAEYMHDVFPVLLSRGIGGAHARRGTTVSPMQFGRPVAPISYRYPDDLDLDLDLSADDDVFSEFADDDLMSGLVNALRTPAGRRRTRAARARRFADGGAAEVFADRFRRAGFAPATPSMLELGDGVADHPLFRQYGADALMALSGVLPGADVWINSASGDQLGVNWSLGNGDVEAGRSIAHHPGQQLAVTNSAISSRLPGGGTSSYLRQLDALLRHGAASAKMFAAGDASTKEQEGGYGGYYVWPAKFGVDGPLPRATLSALRELHPEKYAALTSGDEPPTVQRLLQMQGGDELWESLGQGFFGTLRPNSPRVLELATGHLEKILSGKRKRYAGGGSAHSAQQEIPALLTPDEYVFSPSASKKIGYSNLEYMNRFGDIPPNLLDQNGKVRRYHSGGRVQLAGGGDPANGQSPLQPQDLLNVGTDPKRLQQLMETITRIIASNRQVRSAGLDPEDIASETFMRVFKRVKAGKYDPAKMQESEPEEEKRFEAYIRSQASFLARERAGKVMRNGQASELKGDVAGREADAADAVSGGETVARMNALSRRLTRQGDADGLDAAQVGQLGDKGVRRLMAQPEIRARLKEEARRANIPTKRRQGRDIYNDLMRAELRGELPPQPQEEAGATEAATQAQVQAQSAEAVKKVRSGKKKKVLPPQQLAQAEKEIEKAQTEAVQNVVQETAKEAARQVRAVGRVRPQRRMGGGALVLNEVARLPSPGRPPEEPILAPLQQVLSALQNGTGATSPIGKRVEVAGGLDAGSAEKDVVRGATAGQAVRYVGPRPKRKMVRRDDQFALISQDGLEGAAGDIERELRPARPHTPVPVPKSLPQELFGNAVTRDTLLTRPLEEGELPLAVLKSVVERGGKKPAPREEPTRADNRAAEKEAVSPTQGGGNNKRPPQPPTPPVPPPEDPDSSALSRVLGKRKKPVTEEELQQRRALAAKYNDALYAMRNARGEYRQVAWLGGNRDTRSEEEAEVSVQRMRKRLGANFEAERARRKKAYDEATDRLEQADADLEEWRYRSRGLGPKAEGRREEKDVSSPTQGGGNNKKPPLPPVPPTPPVPPEDPGEPDPNEAARLAAEREKLRQMRRAGRRRSGPNVSPPTTESEADTTERATRQPAEPILTTESEPRKKKRNRAGLKRLDEKMPESIEFAPDEAPPSPASRGAVYEVMPDGAEPIPVKGPGRRPRRTPRKRVDPEVVALAPEEEEGRRTLADAAREVAEAKKKKGKRRPKIFGVLGGLDNPNPVSNPAPDPVYGPPTDPNQPPPIPLAPGQQPYPGMPRNLRSYEELLDARAKKIADKEEARRRAENGGELSRETLDEVRGRARARAKQQLDDEFLSSQANLLRKKNPKLSAAEADKMAREQAGDVLEQERQAKVLDEVVTRAVLKENKKRRRKGEEEMPLPGPTPLPKEIEVDAQGNVLGTRQEVDEAAKKGLTPPGAEGGSWWERAKYRWRRGLRGAANSVSDFYGRSADWGNRTGAGQWAFAASFALPMVGSGIQSTAGDPEVAARAGGATEFGYKAATAVGGAVTGAGVGAAVGNAILPGFGAPIGAAIGAVAGFVSAMKDAANAIRSARLELAIGHFADRLQVLASVGSILAPAQYRQEATGYLDQFRRTNVEQAYANSGLLWSSSAALTAGIDKGQRQNLSQMLAPMQQYIQTEVTRIVRDGNGRDLTAARVLDVGSQDPFFERLLQEIARLKQISVRDVRNELAPMVVSTQNRLRVEEVQKAAAGQETGRVSAFGQLARNVEAASASLSALKAASQSLQEQFEGQFANPSRVEVNPDALSRISSNDPGAMRLLDSFRGLGPEGVSLAGMGQTVGRAREALSATLREVARNSFQETEGGAMDFSSQVQTQLQRQLGDSPDSRRVVTSVIAGLNEKLTGERRLAGVMNDISLDNSGLVESLLARAASPVQQFGRQILEARSANANDYVERLSVGRRMGVGIGEGQDRLAESELALRRLQAEAEGERTLRRQSAMGDVGTDELLRPSQQRAYRLAVEGGLRADDAFDPERIAQELGRVQGRILQGERAQKEAFLSPDRTGQSFQKAADDLDKLRGQANSLATALKNLGDASQRVAALQERMSLLRSDRDARLGLGERYLGMDYGQKAEFNRGLLLARQSFGRGNVDGLMPQDAGLVFSTLRQFGNARLTGFSDKPVTGNEIADQLANGSAGGAFGLDPGRKAESEKLMADLLREQTRAIESQQKGVDLQVSAQKEFLNGLERMQQTFLNSLRQLLAKDEKRALEAEVASVNVGIGQRKPLVEARETLQKAGVETDDQLKLFQAGRGDFDEYVKLQRVEQAAKRRREAALAAVQQKFEEQKQLAALRGQNDPTRIDGGGLVREGSSFPWWDNSASVGRAADIDDLMSSLNQAERTSVRDNYTRLEGTSLESKRLAFERAINALPIAMRDPAAEAKSELLKGRIQTRLPGLKLDELADAELNKPGSITGALDKFATSGMTFKQLDDAATKANKSLEELAKKIAALDSAASGDMTDRPREVARYLADEVIPGIQRFVRPANIEAAGNDALRFARQIGGGAFFATGGVVGLHPGQPRGTDQIPAWLSEGEFVVNPASSRANRGLLERINGARGAVHLADGGFPSVLGGLDWLGIAGSAWASRQRPGQTERDFRDRFVGELATRHNLWPMPPAPGVNPGRNTIGQWGGFDRRVPRDPFKAPIVTPDGAPNTRILQGGRAVAEQAQEEAAGRLLGERQVPLTFEAVMRQRVLDRDRELAEKAAREQARLGQQMGPFVETVGDREMRLRAALDPFSESGLAVRVGGKWNAESFGRQQSRRGLTNLLQRQMLAQSQNPFAAFGLNRAGIGAQAASMERTLLGRQADETLALRRNLTGYWATQAVQAQGLGGSQWVNFRSDSQDVQGRIPSFFQRMVQGRGFANGGLVPSYLAVGGMAGPDNIPIYAQAGEYILPKRAVDRVGVPALDGLRSGSAGITAPAGATSSGLNPEVVKAIEASSRSMEAAMKMFNASVGTLQAAIMSFSASSGELAKALSSFEGKLQVSGTQSVNVNLNGAEVLSRLMPDLVKMVNQVVRDRISQVFKQTLPDVQLPE